MFPRRKTTRRLTVRGMTCDGCAGHVRRALREVRGVHDVHVVREAGLVNVVTEQDVECARLVEAVRNVGYEAEVAP